MTELTDNKKFPDLDNRINVKNEIRMGYEDIKLGIVNIDYVYFKQPFIQAQILNFGTLTEVKAWINSFSNNDELTNDPLFVHNWRKLQSQKHFIFITMQEIKLEAHVIYGNLYYKGKLMYTGYFKHRVFCREGTIYMNHYQLKGQFDTNGNLYKECEIWYNNNNEYIKFMVILGVNFPIQYISNYNLIIHFHNNKCTILYPSGSLYVGAYIIDCKKIPVVRRHGYGVYTSETGLEMSGTFANDKKNGLFMLRQTMLSMNQGLPYTVYVFQNDAVKEKYIDGQEYLEITEKQLKKVIEM
jgi:hypothetical protein